MSFEELSSRLDACKQPFLMMLKLCCQPVSAAGSENKAREMVSGLVLGFERYVAERPELKGPDTKVQDMAFQLFMSKQCSLPVIQSAFISFGLVGCIRYNNAIMCKIFTNCVCLQVWRGRARLSQDEKGLQQGLHCCNCSPAL